MSLEERDDQEHMSWGWRDEKGGSLIFGIPGLLVSLQESRVDLEHTTRPL